MMCRPFVDFRETLQADVINFYMDAAKSDQLGFGCYFDGGGLLDFGRDSY